MLNPLCQKLHNSYTVVIMVVSWFTSWNTQIGKAACVNWENVQVYRFRLMNSSGLPVAVYLVCHPLAILEIISMLNIRDADYASEDREGAWS